MNIAEILKYCPEDTELYSTIWGKVTLGTVFPTGNIDIKIGNVHIKLFNDGKYFYDGECILFPSEDQRDWSKFRFPVKKGDIMMKCDGSYPFISNGITTEDGCFGYICGVIGLSGSFQISSFPLWTDNFCIPASEEAKKILFDKIAEAGYKWNTDTLKLEKLMPTFKEGDVIADKNDNLYLVHFQSKDYIFTYCLFTKNGRLDVSGIPVFPEFRSVRLASPREKEQLKKALNKNSYILDTVNHCLVKQDLKPFDKVIVRNKEDEKWLPSIFLCYEDEEVDKLFPYICLNGRYHCCLPYEGNEYLVNTIHIPK